VGAVGFVSEGDHREVAIEAAPLTEGDCKVGRCGVHAWDAGPAAGNGMEIRARQIDRVIGHAALV